MSIAGVDYAEQLEKIRNDIKKKLLPLLQDQDKEILVKLEKDLEETLKRGYLTIAFIGEYSAGKTTLISALTGQRDLKISADIATDECHEYEWNGIRLIDTPGLGTERQDHDERTYEAIKKADLLVYCLTYSLFDTLTLENFKKLAFEQNYQTKMMLLVNKMSAEAGEVEKRIGYYTESLKKSLEPDDLSRFPLVFCDARDQLEGEDEQNEELKAESRFDTLIKELNQFIEKNNMKARLQTPLDMISRCLNTVIENTSDLEDGEEEQHAISQLDRITKDNKDRLENELKEKVSDFKEDIEMKAEALIQDIESVQEDIQGDITRLEQEIKNKSQALCNQMEKHLEGVRFSLSKDVKDLEIKTPLIKNIEISGNISAGDTEVIELKLVSNLVKGIVETTEFCKNLEVAKPVKEASGLLRFFQKGKNTTDASLASIGVRYALHLKLASNLIDICADYQEERRGKKIREVKRRLKNEFSNLAESYKNEFDKHIRQMLKEFFGPLENEILKMRRSYEKKQKSCSQVKQQAIALRDTCVALSKKI